MNESYLNSEKNIALLSKPSIAKRLLLMVLFVSITSLVSFGQTSPQTFYSSGTFVVPAGVTSLTVECWGAGGAGGGSTSSGNSGAGGGAGGYSKRTLAVTPGASISYTVGTGGIGSTGDGTSGGNSSFLSINANGGKGGKANGGSVGTGGTASGGSTNTTGGSGNTGGDYVGGKGGNAPASGGIGGNGSTDNNGSVGNSPGGGGGGGEANYYWDPVWYNRWHYTTDFYAGGNGGNGQIKVSWTSCPTYSLTGSNTATATCVSDGTSTITLKGTATSLPVGTYTVTYNTDVPYQSGKTATMTVSTAGIGTFTTTGLTLYSGVSGISTVTVTNISLGSCSNAVSANNTAAVTVYATPVEGGVYSGTTPICLNSSTGTMTLGGGYVGSVVNWEKRLLPSSTWISIANTTTSYSESPSVAGTWEYRAIVGNGPCAPTKASAAFSVVVNPALSITLASANTTVCQNSTSASLAYTATTGSPAQWQIDFDAAAVSAGFAAMQTSGLATAPGTITINVPWSVAAGVYKGNLKVISYTPSCSSASYPITVTVNSNGAAGVSIASSTSGEICSGISVIFTATPINGGATPSYQWKLNGANVGTNSATYINATLANNDVVTCVMTSSLTCVTGSPATSNTITATVNAATSAPIVGTKTQPNCATATGSVVLNGLPSGSWILTQNPGGTTTTGTGTSTTISGLSSGTYTYSVVGANNGLKAEYFNNMTLSGSPVLTRTDATVNFDWANASPDASINNDYFSARWSGLVQPLYSETYTFKTTSDDGVRLWVNGVKIIDNWTDHAVFDNTGTIALTAGEKYNIVLEYYENGGLAVSKLSWSSPTNPTSVIIPTTQLFSVSTCSSPASANVVIDAQPAVPVTPTVGAPTQPTCSVPTGSFAITNYNSSYTYSVSPSTGVTISGSTVTAPVGSYTVTASLGGCTSSASSSVAINSAVAKTWNGTTWLPSLVPPTKNDVVIINGDYNTSSNGDLNACSLTINAGYKLTITPLQFVVVQNDLTVNGTLDVLDKGSLVMVNDAGIVKNNGTTNIHRFTTEYKKLDYVYWSTPVTSTTIASTFLNWRIDRAFEYNNGWKFATSLIPAMGCAITVPNPIVTSPPTPNISEVVFKGQVNNGVIKVKNIAPSALYLIGNPYPSAIDADAFLNENAGAIEGTIYFWTHNTAIQLASNIKNGTAGSGAYAFTSDDYAVYNIVGGVATGLLPVSNSTIPTTLKPKGEIASCQGFFASSNAADKLTSTDIVFKNAMRLGSGITASLDNTNFFRTKASKTAKTFEKNRLWLNLTNTGGAFKQLLVGYVTDATNDYESRFDGESFAGNQYIDFYSVVKDKNLTIQGRALPFDEKDEVPLGYNTTIEGAFTISIDDVDGFMANQSVFLEDKLTNTVFDLKAGNYTFNTAKGTFNDRFVLKYANKTLGMEDVVEKEDGILALYANNYQTLIIHNKGISSTVNSVALFNMTGQRIGVWNVKDFEQTNIQIPIKDISSGIYIVKISTTNGDSSKKIVIN